MKLRERIIICFSVTFVLLTILLVIDLQFDFGYTGQHFLLPARHGHVYSGDTVLDGERSIYKKFQNRFGDEKAVEEQLPSSTENMKNLQYSNETIEGHDTFMDLILYAADDKTSQNMNNLIVIDLMENRTNEASLIDLMNVHFGE